MAYLTRRQRHNICRALLGVQERAHNHNWSRARAAHVALMVVNCGLTESVWHNFGNVANRESQHLADRQGWGWGNRRWIGSDHDSVGVFQQRVPMWGTTRECMEPKLAAHKFMNRAGEVGVDDVGNGNVWGNIQSVQVSFDPTGRNYAVNTDWAQRIVRRAWDTQNRTVRGRWRTRVAHNWKFPK